MYRPSDYSEDKTPEDVFRERYDLSPNKLFQKAVWDLHSSGVPLKEAESMVAQEAFVQSERRKRVAAKETSTQLSFPEEQGGGVRGQQGRQGYVPLVAKKARVAQAKHLARAREKLQSSKSKPPPNVLQASSRFGQPKKVASKAAGGPCEPPKPRPKAQKMKNPSQNVTFHQFLEETEPPAPIRKKGRKALPKVDAVVEEDEGYDTADEELFFDVEHENVDAPFWSDPNAVRGDSTMPNEDMPVNDYIDMPDLTGTILAESFRADMRPSDIFKKVVREEIFFVRWANNTNKKYEQWKQGGGKS